MSQKWCMTLNNYTPEELKQIEDAAANCTYAIIGMEVGEKGTPHLQAFFNFGRKNRKRLSALKKLSARAHWEIARGSDIANRDYCSKEKVHLTIGEPQSQGTRTDIQEAVDLLNQGKTLSDVAVACPDVFIKYGRGLRDYITTARLSKSRDFKTEVHVLIGPPGCGKTRKAFELGPDNTYFKPRGEWWDGYLGQPRVVIDDFYGWIKYDEMLRLCDRYPMQVPIKGAFVNFAPKEIYITSNETPNFWYKFEGYNSDALCRRMTTMKIFDSEKNMFIDTQTYKINY